MFESFGKELTFAKIEEELIEFWKKARIFEKSVDLRSESPRFVFYEGPPTANGLPGVHHVMARTVKDLICRYMTMQGFLVERKAGWDTHGLPVEIEVEQELNLSSKEQIESYGIAAFNKRCRESVFRYEKEWRNVTERIGFWLDLDNPYITCTNEYIETVWWILKRFFDEGLIYRAHKILPYCPRCGTALSSHEVSQGYEEVQDPSVYVRFRQRSDPGTSFLVWTTTPWTLISNVALAVHPDEKYAKVRLGDESFILAAERLNVLSDDYQTEEEFPGQKLAGLEYEPVFPFFSSTPGAFRVETADFVTMEEGTGIVHIAPAFGEDDYNLGKERSLPVLQPVDEDGHLTEEVTPWAGVFVKDADKGIIKDLGSRGLLYRSETVVHSYPFCWRCESPLIYYARESWNIRTTAYRDLMLKCNSDVEWHPRDVGVLRFANWIENNVDWALSRDRYWGTPLNIWICEACAAEVCVGSVEELRNLGAFLPSELDLHKPMVDEFVLECPRCGGGMRRTPEVIDCWFDSGSMPYGQWHYPFENTDKFEQSFPADFISEGMDQSRGWFYSLLAISTFMSGVSCFKSVVPIEMILDKNGQRMSKSKGNTVDPAEILEREGADALRWYLLTVSPPWIPTRFDRDGVAEVASKLLATLRNTCQFFVLYANIDGFRPSGRGFERSVMDKWIISRLHSLIRAVRSDMDAYELTRAARSIQEFVIEDLSNWYVRRCRRRFWKAELGPDKLGAYETLYEVLVTVAKLIAPFVPFVSEEIYQKIARNGQSSAPDSVHLCRFPEVDETLIDRSLEEKMNTVLRVISLGRAARNAAKLKIRQPLSELCVVASEDLAPEALVELGNLVKEELNIKNITVVQDEAEVCELVGKPKYETLGPRFGKSVGEVATAIASMKQVDLQKIVSGEPVKVNVSGKREAIFSSEIEVGRKEKPGFAIVRDGPWVVAVRTEITEELKQEGVVREFVHRLQSLRKEANLEVSDRIVLFYEASETLGSTLEKFGSYIASEALATGIHRDLPESGAMVQWDLEGEGVKVALKKAE
ncbi:MAG: isoleucyl-tRNA synthase [Latescibacteria bacterium DG_63]|nr:MAG: isoleucyl-tRNA synthase [Latescibacteria bacterium DG_63]